MARQQTLGVNAPQNGKKVQSSRIKSPLTTDSLKGLPSRANDWQVLARSPDLNPQEGKGKRKKNSGGKAKQRKRQSNSPTCT